MKNETLSLIAGFAAMLLVGASYFLTKKKQFLFFQAAGIFFIMTSYLFDELYFATIGVGVSLIRTLVYFVYEEKNKTAPLWLGVFFCAVSVLSYAVVNLWILKTARPLDIVCLLSLISYTLVMRVRDLNKVRYWILLPIVLSIVYNVCAFTAIFVVISYFFELFMSVSAIFKYRVFNKKTKENTDERN